MFVLGVDPTAQPEYCHEILTEDELWWWHNNSAQQNVQHALSGVKVCKQDAMAAQNVLKTEYFSEWHETCDVVEVRKVSVNDLEAIVYELHRQFNGVNFDDIRRKIKGVLLAPSLSHKVFEFTFGNNIGTGIDSGVVYFGIICFAKSRDGQTVDVVSSLYKLDFSLASEKFVVTTTFNLFGFIPLNNKTTVCYRKKKLRHLTTRQIKNFCRFKVMEAFRSKGFIDFVPYVGSISAVGD